MIWLILLGWSYDALRAAAFRLMHRYMREVGDAIAADPNEKIRKDMSPAEAGGERLPCTASCGNLSPAGERARP